jgi:hypothetical protein
MEEDTRMIGPVCRDCGDHLPPQWHKPRCPKCHAAYSAKVGASHSATMVIGAWSEDEHGLVRRISGK